MLTEVVAMKVTSVQLSSTNTGLWKATVKRETHGTTSYNGFGTYPEQALWRALELLRQADARQAAEILAEFW